MSSTLKNRLLTYIRKITNTAGTTYIDTEQTSNEIVCNVNGAEALRIHDDKSVEIQGDFYNVPWTDYSAVSSISGFSAISSKVIYIKKLGKTVFVAFRIQGTSNSTSKSFTVPYEKFGSETTLNYMLATNNGTATSTGTYVYIAAASSSTMICANNFSATGWTDSGTAVVQGQFFYESA